MQPDRPGLPHPGSERRHFLLAGVAAALSGAACQPRDTVAHIQGDFMGVNLERGHLLQQPRAQLTSAYTRQTGVLIAGGGVAGLAAARALRLAGQEDFAVLELEDSAGGNSRAGNVAGLPCPLGAHYLPLPGDSACEVQDLLEELGLRQRLAGRWVYDERHLCHSPQERLFFNGAWQEGLLPLQGVGRDTLAQYQRFAALVAQLQQQAHWAIPSVKVASAQLHQTLSAITFKSFLTQNSLHDRYLHAYLDYCCRDDYGAGTATVSAWAGIHYFASRHGFSAPGTDAAEHDPLLTWPEGNAWITQRLAAPLGTRLHTGRVVVRVASVKHGVQVDAWNAQTQQLERWQARQAIVALPIFVAARVLENPPDWLLQAAAQTRYAPWLVANIHIRQALHDPPGAAPSWDNVIYQDAGADAGLGYVDASHQRLQSKPDATVLTYYRALGDHAGGAAALPSAAGVAGRHWLLAQPWHHWRDRILTELSVAHPDLVAKVSRIDITRYGHAMAIPTPSNTRQISLQPILDNVFKLSKSHHSVDLHRLQFAHSDWAGYSVFEEAFTLGHWAGRQAQARL
jgi:monoamine oxidase